MGDSIEIVVFGAAQPAGSKRAFPHPHTKQIIISDANPKARDWKNHVAQAAGQQYGGEVLDGPLALAVTFFEPRPKGHFGTGRNAHIVKDSAPLYPAKKPDTTKLVRGTEDAMTGIVYRDDSQVVDLRARKRYGEPARCEISVRQKQRERVGDAVFVQPELLAAA